MNRLSHLHYVVLLGFVLSIAAVLLAQLPPNKTLVVNGKTTDAAIKQIDGRSYVDIETLAQITNGIVTVEPNRIVLTIPVSNAGAAPPPVPEGLSKNFASVAIAVLAEMREWRGAIGTILMYGAPVVGTWPQDYHNRVEADLMQAAVAASTAADQDALGLLRNEFANLAQWASDVVATRQALNATKTVNPDIMQNDPALAKISDCSRFLGSMLVSGVFADNPSCH
ncbi:MAG: hypothetical protein LAN18_12590 [Acidobacteriia bacterium]|nr:hypothetical protein [Terriglobia bacterium]